MAFNIEEFRYSFKNGFAKKNLFECRFSGVPHVLLTKHRRSFEDLRFRAKLTELPGKRVLTEERIYGGEALTIPYTTGVTPINMEILDDANYSTKRMFDDWQSLIVKDENAPENVRNYKLNYYKNIIADKLSISMFDVYGRKKYEITLSDVYPITMVQTSLDWSDDGVFTFGVELQYRGWSSSKR